MVDCGFILLSGVVHSSLTLRGSEYRKEPMYRHDVTRPNAARVIFSCTCYFHLHVTVGTLSSAV